MCVSYELIIHAKAIPSKPCFRYAGVIWWLFLIGPVYLIGVWLGEDQRTNAITTHVVKNRLDYVFKFC